MTVHSKQITSLNEKSASKQKEHSFSQTGMIAAITLGLIILLGTFLRLYELGAYSVGNTYYAATVQSMLTSWKNFFFVAFEPGGSVSVDKPPLGFWVQAISAYFLGVNGFALALPNAIAGTLSIPLLYSIVKRQFNQWAGLLAALVLAVVPVTIATERNNTIDGMLVFVLLLATWAFLKSIYSGKVRYLVLGAVLVGLGFNIKMLQAYMVLPALYLVYFLGARHAWWRRMLHLMAATVVLIVVSLSWAIIVDLTPADSRPYVGSSTDNSMMELIIGHNGLKRLGLSDLLYGDDGTSAQASGDGGLAQAAPSQGNMRPPNTSRAQNVTPPQNMGISPQGNFPPGRPQMGSNGNRGMASPQGRPGGAGAGTGASGSGGGFSHEVGQAGVLRLFTEPLADEASWLLPVALLGIPLAAVTLGWAWPLTEKHLGLILWAGWLLPIAAYFTLTTGLFHAYYLIMLGPPLAALVGMSAWALWRTIKRWPWLGWVAALGLSSLTLAYQAYILISFPEYLWVIVVSSAIWLAGLALLIRQAHPWYGKAALALVCLSLLVAPLAWSGLTALNTNPNVSLPNAGPNTGEQNGPNASSTVLSPSEEIILDYLLANTDPDNYLVAGLSSHDVSGYILATGRPALTFGGFNGGDDVIGVDELSQMTSSGDLRFVLDTSLSQRKPEITEWLQSACLVVKIKGLTQTANSQQAGPRQSSGGRQQSTILYDCGSYVAAIDS